MTDASPWRRETTGLAAHRGGRLEAPENTIYAMREAVAAGAHAIEFDIQGTADGVPVVLHDEDLERVAGLDARVDTLTLDEVRAADPCHDHDVFAGVATGKRDPPGGHDAAEFRVPTLDEVLEAFPSVPLIVELKETAPPEAVARCIDTAGRGPGIMVISFDDDAVDAIRERVPDVAAAPGVRGLMAFQEGAGGRYDALNVPYDFGGQRLVNEAFVQRANEAGLAVLVWTVNDEDVAEQLIEARVDYIVTDRPRAFALKFMQ